MKRTAAYAALLVLVCVAGWARTGLRAQSGPLAQGAPAVLAAPPNAPADVDLTAGRLRIRYHGVTIFEGQIANPGAIARATVNASNRGDAVDQVVALTASSSRNPIELSGTVHGSVEAFPVESDRPLRGLAVVRHSSGLSRSLRNQSVYDRRWDWVLSVDDHPRTQVRVRPLAETGEGRTFSLDARGGEVLLRFRPRFYQQHRGLSYFEPWTYAIWPQPIVGWCSWFAFFDRVTEADIRQTADVVAEVLAPFGYEYIQMDDGYQRATGAPEFWLKANEKFPSGLGALAAYIRQKGLKPGIWTNAAFSQADIARQHKDWFVVDPNGEPARGNWIGHVVDGSNPEALDALVRPIYRELRNQGWAYFKLDALRHLRYEGYNAYGGYFAKKGVPIADAYRSYVRSVRDEIGRDRVMLACWGVRPELVGLADACRIGTDGFSFAGLAQFNSFNNVVWRNDPDHIELSEREAWRSTMVTSLTGSLFMLTDRPERYRTEFVEPARRAAPVLVTVPGQLYDVDASRSSQIWRADLEVSGRDPKPFDAGLEPAAHLYLLEVNRPFESWMVLGRTGGDFDRVPFDELGLDPAKEYLVFEFWEKRLVGSFSRGFDPGIVPAKYNSQVFVIRERAAHPQVLATSRHVTGGGVDLLAAGWDGAAVRLSGRSRLVAGDPYEVYVHVPPGFTPASAACEDAGVPVVRDGAVVRFTCRAETSRDVGWSVYFRYVPTMGREAERVRPSRGSGKGKPVRGASRRP
jgi:alpha-galactosidase